MDEVARAEIDARVVTQIRVGDGVQIHQIAAAKVADAADLRVGFVVALVQRRALEIDPDLLEAILGKAGAVVGRRAVGGVDIGLAQLVLRHVDDVFQLLRLAHAGAVGALAGSQRGGNGRGVVLLIARHHIGRGHIVRRRRAAGQAHRAAAEHPGQRARVHIARLAQAVGLLEELDRLDRGGAKVSVHAGGLDEVAQRVQLLLHAGNQLALGAAAQRRGRQRRQLAVAGIAVHLNQRHVQAAPILLDRDQRALGQRAQILSRIADAGIDLHRIRHDHGGNVSAAVGLGRGRGQRVRVGQRGELTIAAAAVQLDIGRVLRAPVLEHRDLRALLQRAQQLDRAVHARIDVRLVRRHHRGDGAGFVRNRSGRGHRVRAGQRR